MQLSKLKNTLRDQLIETGLVDRPGSVLYSGEDTLKKGKYLFFGLNPGGREHETQTVLQHFDSKPADFNEYCDGEWAPAGRTRSKGMAPLQQRVQFLLASLTVSPRLVCATNLVFVRSRDMGSLSEPFERLAAKCWPVHKLLLEQVDPDIILVMGKGFSFFQNRLSRRADLPSFPSGHGSWMCEAAFGMLEGRERLIIGLPHLSRYKIQAHPDVIGWIKSLNETHLK